MRFRLEDVGETATLVRTRDNLLDYAKRTPIGWWVPNPLTGGQWNLPSVEGLDGPTRNALDQHFLRSAQTSYSAAIAAAVRMIDLRLRDLGVDVPEEK